MPWLYPDGADFTRVLQPRRDVDFSSSLAVPGPFAFNATVVSDHFYGRATDWALG
jgi:hypothetical protein